jgi:formylglycine-generating enzyme
MSTKRIAILSLCVALVAQTAQAITINTIPVGNVGNANDPADGDVFTAGIQNFGAVPYAYRIGKYEVTIGQYTAFLNAVAATDTYALYNTSMATDLNIAGIAQSGSPGTYVYSPIGSANKPIAYVSWGDAARFCNWLHNGQPTGAQNLSTTEDGAYTLNGGTTDAALAAVTRNAGARWFIPTENEWYKAAYHKNDGPSANYWQSPTGTNSPPYSDQPPGSGAPTQSNTANFFADDGIANGYNDGYAVTGSRSLSSSQNYLTDAGAYTSATSPYGTFDQGGNVIEWNEALINGVFRGLRGGSWHTNLDALLSSDRFYDNPTFVPIHIGFRVATVVPEPSTGVLMILACGTAWWWRKRFNA